MVSDERDAFKSAVLFVDDLAKWTSISENIFNKRVSPLIRTDESVPDFGVRHDAIPRTTL
jgi:hypothetical protein